MNIATGTFGYGVPTVCPECHTDPLQYDVIADGWHAPGFIGGPERNVVDIPVTFFIRVSKRDGESGERALLIAKDETGKMWTFTYDNIQDDPQDLTVNDFEEKK